MSDTSRQCYACAFLLGLSDKLTKDYAAQRTEIRRLRKALREVISEVQDGEDRGLALFRCNAVAVRALKPRRGSK
jgi:hypothetical protein